MNPQKPQSIVFCRVSSKEQADEGYSLESQEKLLTEYAGDHGFEVCKTYKIAETASKDHVRKLFNEVFEYSRKKNIPVILCEKIDRLTRSLKSAAIADDWVKELSDREIHFVKESFILNNKTKAHENLVWDMKVAIARFYTNNLSEEVRKGNAEKLRQGWRPYRAPLGYRTIGEKGHKTQVIDETTSPYVKMIFELYSSGLYSVPDLAILMYEKGLRSNITGRKVAANGIYAVLKNPFYYGSILWGGKHYPGKHEPIVTKDQFESAQRVLTTGRPDKYVKHNPLFKGLASCGNCGHKISWYEKKGHWYGRCAHYKSCGQGKLPIREDRLMDQVFPFIRDLQLSEQDITKIKENLTKDHKDEIQVRQTLENDIARKLAINDSKLDVVYQDRLSGRISTEKYDAIKIQVEADSEQLIQARKQLLANTIDYFDFGINLLELANKLKELFPFATKEEKQEIFTLAFEGMTVTDKTLITNYTPWFAKLRKHVPELQRMCEPLQNPMDKRKNTNLVVDVHSWLGRQGSNLRHGD